MFGDGSIDEEFSARRKPPKTKHSRKQSYNTISSGENSKKKRGPVNFLKKLGVGNPLLSNLKHPDEDEPESPIKNITSRVEKLKKKDLFMQKIALINDDNDGD
mmetsp:Transcript_36384/g.55858  ORF Transcript_36384/g.55858 Transcript_36384/m.55858 type:complete len:103 (+) Transcript_36384:419-727(+)